MHRFSLLIADVDDFLCSALPPGMCVSLMPDNSNPANIAESEWPIMEVLWEKGTATSQEISGEVTARRGIAPATVKVLINRLVKKGAVSFERDAKDSRVYHYSARIAREDLVAQKNGSLLRMVYGNNPMKLLMSFVKGANLTSDDIDELRSLLDEKERAD